MLLGSGNPPVRWGARPVFVYGFDDLRPLQREAVAVVAASGAEVVVSLTFEPGRYAFAGRTETVPDEGDVTPAAGPVTAGAVTLAGRGIRRRSTIRPSRAKAAVQPSDTAAMLARLARKGKGRCCIAVLRHAHHRPRPLTAYSAG